MKACMVVHSYYPDDGRVRREAEALLRDGWAVDVLCLRQEGEQSRENCSGAHVYRFPLRRHRGGGLATYLLEYSGFSLIASATVSRLHLRQHYDIIQVHNMPDFLIFTGLVPRLLGAKLVLDMHDLVPELYAQRFGGSDKHPLVRATRIVEGKSIAFAHHVITAGEPFRRRLIARGVPADKITVIMNSADPSLFSPVLQPSRNGRKNESFTVLYHGGLFVRYGLDIAIRAMDQVRAEVPNVVFHIYGDGEAVEDLQRLVGDLDLTQWVTIHDAAPLDDIPKIIDSADLGVVPYRRNPFTDLLYPTKAFEYIAMGVPVIMADTEAVQELFRDVPDVFFPAEDVDELAERIVLLYRQPERRQRLLQSAAQAYAPYAWESQAQKYVSLMRSLVSQPDRVETRTDVRSE